MRFILLSFIFLSCIHAETAPSPQQLEIKLEKAEAQLDRAKKMFSPWYTGPLITPSASMCPPGFGLVQPYVFLGANWGRYDLNRTARDIPNEMVFKSSNVFQFGLTNTVDIIATFTGAGQWQDNQHGGGFADIPVNIGFLVFKQTLYVPQIKFNIQETFPTGRYQRLSSNGLALSGLGGGSYQTTFALSFGKLLFWTKKHPVNTRLYLGYNLATAVHVKGFNSYGGGYGAHGTVKPGNSFTADFGIEYSITQKWALALDLAYTAQNKTKFHGDPGVLKGGVTSSVGGGYNDNLSLAPALEYNWSDSLGIIGGFWFSTYGRNSLAFTQGVISVYWLFPAS